MSKKMIGLTIGSVLIGGLGVMLAVDFMAPSKETLRQEISASFEERMQEGGYPEEVENSKDMRQYRRETSRKIESGEYEEALERLIWYYENAVAHDRREGAVRNSFALADWHHLAQSFPPAMEALIETRDRRASALLEGKGNEMIFSDLRSINREIGETEQTVLVFQALHKKDPDLADSVWRRAKDAVLEHEKFNLAEEYLDPRYEFREIVNWYKRFRVNYENGAFDDDPCGGKEEAREFHEDRFVEDTLTLVRAVDALGDREAAVKMLNESAEELPDPRFEAALDRLNNPESKMPSADRMQEESERSCVS